MAVRIVKQDEKLTTVIDGTTFDYRRIPYHVNVKLEKKHTNRGVVDYGKVNMAALGYGILSWEGMADGVEFDVKLIPFLPTDVRVKLVNLIYQNSDPDADDADTGDQVEDELGNFDPTSSLSSQTADWTVEPVE